MLRYILMFIMMIHGLIHFLGFAKAMDLAPIQQLTQPVPRMLGWIWLAAGVLLIISSFLYLWHLKLWIWTAISGVIISQWLIFSFWHDAKWGTLANVIILIIALASYSLHRFEKQYLSNVSKARSEIDDISPRIIEDADILHLPIPVQTYLKYVGVINRPEVLSYKVNFHGNMGDKDQPSFDFTSEQYNFIENMERHFFMKAIFKGLPTYGYHNFSNGKASMDIRVLGCLPVVHLQSEELKRAETVTIFNDMCLLAPATLIDKHIVWENLDAQSCKAYFTHDDVTITATLHFNEAGQLINFVSDDRYNVSAKQFMRFSTPVSAYKNFNGYHLMSIGEARWHYQEGPFTYGKFFLDSVHFNPDHPSKAMKNKSTLKNKLTQP